MKSGIGLKRISLFSFGLLILLALVCIAEGRDKESRVYRLYYLDDPVRLLQVLSNNRAKELDNIFKSTLDLKSTTLSLDALEISLQKAIDEARKARADLKNLKDKKSKAVADNAAGKTPLTDAKKEQTEAQKVVDQKTDALSITETNLAREKAIDAQDSTPETKEAVKQAEIAKADAQRDLDLAKITKTQKDRKVAELEGQAPKPKPVPTDKEIKDAETAVAEKQKEVVDLQGELQATALLDALSFGAAIDRGALWWAPAKSKGIIAQESVTMFAFPDSRMLYFHGSPKDLEELAKIVRQFDQPEPQARLTLWTLEMSSKAKEKNADKVAESLSLIQDDLIETSEDIENLALYFQLVVREAVKNCSSGKMGDSNDHYRARLNFYAEDVCEILRVTKIKDTSLLRRIVPDPANINTLAEALIIHSLSSEETQKKTQRHFKKGVKGVLQLDLRYPDSKKRRSKIERCIAENAPDPSHLNLFPFDAFYGEDCGVCTVCLSEELKACPNPKKRGGIVASPDRTGIFGREIALSLRELGTRRMLSWLEPQFNGSGTNLLNSGPFQTKVITELKNRGVIDVSSGQRSVTKIQVQQALAKVSGAQPLSRQPNRYNLSREAAVNETMKDLLQIIDDRVQAGFIRPMYARIRCQLKSKGIQVGVLQKTSVLARNRLVARVSPRASASIPLGTEQDILKATVQLGQIFTAAKSTDILASLVAQQERDKENTKKPEEIYGITSGNRFQVTPVIDPSGQALRFRFDFNSQSQIKDPDGSSNPRFNRIERHTINTEIQLSNFELREISRFESNARLGMTSKRSGGIPVLNDIPGLKEVPLIGWFSRRYGSKPVTQQSLILGHTAIFPTIGSVYGLLVSEMPSTKEQMSQTNRSSLSTVRRLPYPGYRPPQRVIKKSSIQKHRR